MLTCGWVAASSTGRLAAAPGSATEPLECRAESDIAAATGSQGTTRQAGPIMTETLKRSIAMPLAMAAGLCLAATADAAQPAAPSRNADVIVMGFALADTDRDRAISEAELVNDAAAAFAQLDRNRDRVLSVDELDAHDGARFVEIDIDRDGRLSFIEVMTAKMADFNAADTNHDGKLSLPEIKAMKPHAWQATR